MTAQGQRGKPEVTKEEEPKLVTRDEVKPCKEEINPIESKNRPTSCLQENFTTLASAHRKQVGDKRENVPSTARRRTHVSPALSRPPQHQRRAKKTNHNENRKPLVSDGSQTRERE